MKGGGRRRNAVILAFVAQLLHAENNNSSGVAAAVSPLASSSSSAGNSSVRPLSLHRRTFSTSRRAGSSPLLSSSRCAFVQCDSRKKSSTSQSIINRRNGNGVSTRTPSSCHRRPSHTTINRLTNNRSVATPRYYVNGSSSQGSNGSPSSSSSSNGSSSVEESSSSNLAAASSGDQHFSSNSRNEGGTTTNDVLIYRNSDEFSLLKPTLEFNELDLQELFAQKKKTTKEVVVGRSGTSSAPPPVVTTSSSSQFYGELEEVEIAHWRPEDTLPLVQEEEIKKGGDVSAAATTVTSSPFFFATVSVGEQQHHSPNVAPSSSQDQQESIPTPLLPSTVLPPWLSLNQSRFAPMKLRKLQHDLNTHLSSKEIDTVVSAIHTAAGGDFKKVAGASDFCSILVNSLEITDVPALCASAFHYSSLVAVRERELDSDMECSLEEHKCIQHAGSDAKYLCALAGSGIESFGTHAVKIALDAARLKSMETLASEVVVARNAALDSQDARNLRSLLLSVNEEGDWRALAIRSAACLYRLEGLEAHRSLSSSSTTTTTTPKTTRARVQTLEESRASQEALHIYAPLAARLGMFRLKTELEDAAFRTLYPHSHAFVSALCGGENTNSVGEGMKSVLDDITNQMKRVVQEDCTFMENIDNVSVMARVKEPYSVWRKILKMSKESNKPVRSFSILDVPDAVALRVVFSARKLTPDEPDATTQRREREMCYYVLELCTRNWPETSDSRFKDYVKNPKENGYQSLHYSSRKRWRGTEWPFEVQIRSRDMHRVAEYGVAAHWSYKRNDIDGDSSSRAAARLARSSSESSVEEWRMKQAMRSYVDPEIMEPAQHLGDEFRRQRKLERDQTLAPYLEALSGAQTDMTRENVFVFVSVRAPAANAPTEGTVLSLPRGSRVLDAIRVAEKWSSTLESGGNLYDGRNSFVALRNGLRTSAMGSERLDNGDVVSIFPSAELVSSKKRSVNPHYFQ
ncbi:RelA/SpoT family protein [Skeletonema marinoi]|uniref:RelA/SpoT family protein n=1 Tax=Skeletonema marinoi TaxID=267567 RepID=A0AAD8YGM1_9STRA|nr:RelA/SpoT family protein [Skeletonema marinoi]